MASVIPDAVRIYREAGYEHIGGHSPAHFFNLGHVPFTTFLRDNKIVGCPGLALQEVMFMENFRDYIAPERILVIGNAYGWSTVVLALMFPGAKILAMDIDASSVAFTNALFQQHGLAAQAITAESPKDVAAVVGQHLGGAFDFCLIDAKHDNASLTADFAAAHAVAAPGACTLLHDVINWNMMSGVRQIEKQHQLKSKILTRTASGMALIYSALAPAFEAYLDCFSDSAAQYKSLRQYYFANYGDPVGLTMAGYGT